VLLRAGKKASQMLAKVSAEEAKTLNPSPDQRSGNHTASLDIRRPLSEAADALEAYRSI
jgi:hypothetical protein